jgi:hypothetical protein
MKIPEWVKPAAYGAVCGAIALSIVGFSWGGWVTGSTARQMASNQSDRDVVVALTAICLEQSRRDPETTERLATLRAAASYTRADSVIRHGWATMPGTTQPNRQVANACAQQIGA